MNPQERRSRNATISFDQAVRPYHVELARLVAKYATSAHGNVLDFGCGVGNALVEIRRRRPLLKLYAADVDPECLKLTGEKVPLQRSILVDASADVRHFGERFDIVLLSHTLQYAEEPARLVRGLSTLLQPGGYLLVALPNPCTPTKLLANLLRRRSAQGLYAWDWVTARNFLGLFPELHTVEAAHDYVPLPLLSTSRVFAPALRSLGQAFPWLCFSSIFVLART